LAVDKLDGIAQAALVQHVVANGRSLAAMRTAVDRTVIVGLLADPDAIRDLGDDRTSDRAVRANVLARRDCRSRRGRRTSLRRAQTIERKRAKRSQCACRQAGTFQEGAAVEPVVSI